jgi:hypothetical protein
MPGKSAPPGSRAPDIADYLSQRPARAVSRRLALWEIEGGMQCSIIGTCLSDHDLIAVIGKHKLRVDRVRKAMTSTAPACVLPERARLSRAR